VYAAFGRVDVAAILGCLADDVELTVKATGRRIVEEDEVHIWRFDAQGRIRRFAHKVDTHQHWRACGSPGGD
jgi:ketosteroid isomerase-like protein